MLEGPDGVASLPLLQQLAARATTQTLQATGQAPQAPFGDDWRECLRMWRATAGEYHLPCSAAAIPRAAMSLDEADQRRAAGMATPLTNLCPRGVYLLHLHVCPACAAAEAAGIVNTSCEIHTMVALTRGVWVVPDASAASGVERASPAPRPLSPGDRAFLDEALREGMQLSTMRAVSAEEQAQLDKGGKVAQVHVVWREKFALPPEAAALASRTEGELDIQGLALLASALGDRDAHEYAKAPGSRARDAPSRAAAFEGVIAQHRDLARRKGRMVVGLHRSANEDAADASVEYSSAGLIMAARGPNAVAYVHDGEKAYNQLPLHESAQLQFAFYDPISRVTRCYTRCPFGGKQTCTLFSAFSALFKAVIKALLSSHGGGDACERPGPGGRPAGYGARRGGAGRGGGQRTGGGGGQA